MAPSQPQPSPSDPPSGPATGSPSPSGNPSGQPPSGPSTASPSPSGAPSGGDHGQGLFDHPSVNRAPTGALNGGLARENYGGSNTLGDRAASALNGSGANPGGSMQPSGGGRSSGGVGAPASHSAQVAKYKAQANADIGNPAAYRKNRQAAARAGVKLAARSSRVLKQPGNTRAAR